MKYKFFKNLTDLPVLDVTEELDNLIDNEIISWEKRDSQICLNTTKDRPDDIHYGSGSLIWDWQNGHEVFDENGKTVKFVPKPYKVPKNEKDFTDLCSQFKGTVFEKIYRAVSDKFTIGRMRLMLMRPKTCLTWHNDADTRLHYPIETNIGCKMVIKNEVVHMPANTWWLTNTAQYHTAFNASTESRIHLVTSII